MSKKPLSNTDFFRMLATRAVQAVEVPDSLDDEARGVLQHVKEATLEQLTSGDAAGGGDGSEIEAEGQEL